MTLKDGEVLRKDMKKVSESRREVRQPLKAAFYKRNVIDDHYNELTLALTKHCKVVFRAYNEGVAYHFVTDMPGTVTVESETVNINFDKDYQVRIPYVNAREREGEVIEKPMF